ncbi:MAG: hypothetical protein QM639_09155 [Rhodocyclaceae bacterium]
MNASRLFGLLCLDSKASFIPHAPVLGQATARRTPGSTVPRTTVRPSAILEVVHRRGRSWGLLASYEEKRLGL